MEPEHVPDQASAEDIGDILREATMLLRLTPGERGEDAPWSEGSPLKDETPRRTVSEATARKPAKVTLYQRPTQAHYPRIPSLMPALTPLRIAALALGLMVVALFVNLSLAPTTAIETPQQSTQTIAGIRWAMVITSERINDFRRTYHRTPTDLLELGAPGSPLIGYERLSDNRYRLTAPSASGPIVFDSMRPTRDFLARSLDILPDPGTVRP